MKEAEKIIQTLDIEDNCLGLYYNNKFYFQNIDHDFGGAKNCWRHSNIFEEDQENTYVSLYAKGRPLVEYSNQQQSLKSCDGLMASQKQAAKIAKVDISEMCFFDIIPDHLLARWFSLREQAMINVIKTEKRPEDYSILHKIHVLISNISKQKIIVSGVPHKIKYDMFSSATGRLATSRGSYPILNISKEERSSITPQNDMFLELDVNGAEIRTLLAFSGVEQPTGDIHSWNMSSLPPWITRREAKENFFAWLYNPKAENPDYEKFYKKDIYIKHFDGDSVVTPFGRKLKVDKRKALNYLLQSTTSDIVLENAYKIMKKLRGNKSFVAFTMHDSVVLDFAKEDYMLVKEIKQTFEKNMFGKFLSTISIGKDFGNLKEISI